MDGGWHACEPTRPDGHVPLLSTCAIAKSFGGRRHRDPPRLADPKLAADLDAMGRALAHQERVLAGWQDYGGDRAEGEARALLDGFDVPDDVATAELSGGRSANLARV